jgi:pyruvate/2-oxoglutarate dehydrogenase complex dihydrolipoamide dehydrogenase (E3) component
MSIRSYFLLIYILPLYIYTYDYDLIIIGTGASGTIAAQTAARYNVRIATIESEKIPKKRVLYSDIPLKALIRVAQASQSIEKMHELGIDIDISTKHISNVFSYIEKVVENANQIYSTKYLPDRQVEQLIGQAHFIDEHTVEINGQHITSNKFIIATGGEPYVPEFTGIEKIPYLTENNFFQLKELPKSIIIVGEGPLGIEMATTLHRLGVEVTIVTKHGLILPKYDFELIEMQHQLMKMEGIKIYYNTRIKEVDYINNRITARCKNNLSEEFTLDADTFLIALNRNGRIKALNLEHIGIVTHRDGVEVNNNMQTSIDNIYACGDAVGQMYTLSRVGYYQAQIAAHNACKPFWKKNAVADYSNVSSYIYASRPLGAIGLTEQESRKKFGNNLHIYRYSYASFARAQIDNTTDGVAKFICDSSGNLLGVHVLGESADEIIDSVHIGENFADQFENYLFELRTSPNYLDLVWEASKQTELDSNRNIFSAILQYIKRVIPI